MDWASWLQNRGIVSADQGLGVCYEQLLAQLPSHSPLALALLGGKTAATPGLAFLTGYQAALRALCPAAPQGLGALCVTENKSVRPNDMACRWDGQQLNGRKDFVTAADAAQWVLVAARCEAPEQPAQIRLLELDCDQSGVQVELLPALAMMPDIGHARIHFAAARARVLPGDGWDEYVKPFRSIEDLYVLTATVAWLFGVLQRAECDEPLRLQLLNLLSACAELTRHDARQADTHYLLAGAFSQFSALRGPIAQCMAALDNPAAALWTRDQALLSFAQKARDTRLEKARQSLGLDRVQ
ncbi:acyl-CoA dehydrogenase [Atopomonas sediminilitoris]|uniref:acyl-CoA dehydrogenase n=1 Tax=Atopomonas sediminilitoris TaxID=2919919 RepID=UPI001F4F0CBF|nr:acyl-CoA dehydrogenase [Atopomonas sediminilitoris]MCJ8168697.1 acyl-CoA dehydrogenase [Atopomonas sediminilitoris]